MIIRNGLVFGEDKTFAKRDIVIKDGIIVEIRECVENAQDKILDATGLYVIPGLIDIHSHGAVGHDFSDGNPEGMKEILAYQYAHGITSYCPTSMTLSKNKLLEVFKQAGILMEVKKEKQLETVLQEKRNLSQIIGFNMEGPFLDPVKKGAHRKEDIIPPCVDFFRECNEACGNQIRLVTVAPNVEGAMEFIREVAEKEKEKLTVSLGHTCTDYDTAKETFEAGATHVTHLFNGMSPMNHREPGLIGAASENENCMVELICDGVHVHESMVRAAFKLFPGRVILISDSIRATGMPEGIYELGGQQVTVRGNRATLENGTIAGSVTNLFDCMKKAISFGISKEEAVAAATMNPAKSIGIYDRVGSLTIDKQADVILLDKDWNLVQVIK